MTEERLASLVLKFEHRGRPKKSKQKEVKKIAQERGIQWRDIKNLAQNKKEWKENINQLNYTVLHLHLTVESLK